MGKRNQQCEKQVLIVPHNFTTFFGPKRPFIFIREYSFHPSVNSIKNGPSGHSHPNNLCHFCIGTVSDSIQFRRPINPNFTMQPTTVEFTWKNSSIDRCQFGNWQGNGQNIAFKGDGRRIKNEFKKKNIKIFHIFKSFGVAKTQRY
jgi:hypothetical protein